MQIPAEVPVMTLPSATLFPQALLPLYIFEPRYRQMLADMLRTNRMFTVAMQKPGRARETPCAVAGLGLIRVSVDHQDGTSHLILQGLARVQLVKTLRTRPYRIVAIRPLKSVSADSVRIDALTAKVHELVEERIQLGPSPFPFPALPNPGASKKQSAVPGELSVEKVLEYLESLPDSDQVADLVSCALLQNPLQRQVILETANLEQRLKHLIHFLMAEIQQHRKNPGS
jgi:Lon protease-like protein